VQKKHKVRNDITLNQGFALHKKDGNTREFRLSKKGLFASDVKNDDVYVLVNTVDKNKTK